MRGSCYTLSTRRRAGARSNARKPRRVRARRGAGPGIRDVLGLRARANRIRTSGCSARGRAPSKPGRRGRAPGSQVNGSRASRRGRRAGGADGTANAGAGERRWAPRGRVDHERLLQPRIAKAITARGVGTHGAEPQRAGRASSMRGERSRSSRRAAASREACGGGVHRDRIGRSGRTAKAPPPRLALAARTAWAPGRTPGRFDDARARHSLPRDEGRAVMGSRSMFEERRASIRGRALPALVVDK